MKVDPKQNHAIITGDFIGFSDLPVEVRQGMYFILKKCGVALSEIFPGIMPYEVDVFRGDGCQILLTDPVFSLRAALYFRAYIKAHSPEKNSEQKIDSRLAIGVGSIDYVPDRRVSAGDGPAFRVSGKMIEQMISPKSGTMRFAMSGFDEALLLDGIVRMTGALADHWTDKQSLAMTGALQKWTRKQIGGLWKDAVSPQAVGKHLERANWYAVDHGLRVFEGAMSKLFNPW
ncbi:MAG: hypothetical protein HF978_08370 [Desulfobacteraceae bacterium]|nr:hypothetical protein [Desulfobacteraceae bacterium]MBC2755545.1 hypothetical protein [Desulfobacteraceae bacterium]